MRLSGLSLGTRGSGQHAINFITTFHGTYNAANPLKKAYNAIMTRGERVIAISEFIGEHVREVYGADSSRVTVIPRGIDLAVFDRAAVSPERMIRLAQAWRLDDGQPVIMLPGRLTEWKGQAVLIEAVARLGRKDLRCILVGDDQGRTREFLYWCARIGKPATRHIWKLPTVLLRAS